MSSPKKNAHIHKTPVKASSEMKLIISPEKKALDIYSELCRSPSSHPESILFSYERNNEVLSWNESSLEEPVSSVDAQENKQNQPANLQENECFKTVKKSERKPCHCEKSHCLKKYCDCFKLGLTCIQDCLCIGCQNNHLTESHLRSQKMVELTRSGKGGKELKCNCQKSRCLKNYCECHSAGKFCTPGCHCVQCDNRDEEMGYLGRKRKHLMQISEWKDNNILFKQ